MSRLRRTIILIIAYFFISSFVSCQGEHIHTNSDLGLSLSYPVNWIIEEETNSEIILRDTEDNLISITVIETYQANQSFTDFFSEQLDLIIQNSGDPNLPIETSGIKWVEHERYLIVEGKVSFHLKDKVALPTIDPMFNVHAAAFQYQSRIAFVTVAGFGSASLQAAIDEIIDGLGFEG